MRILVFTTVFPNVKQPNLGVFVRERMFKVAQHCELKVVAPVPWFPFSQWLKPGYRAKVPRHEVQDGIEVFHPRFFNIPGAGKFLDGIFLFLSSLWTVWSVRRTFDFDVIDSHFIYPDAVGACLISKAFRRPFTVTLRESDPDKFMRRRLTGMQVLKALSEAEAVFSVCGRLKDYFCALGIARDKVLVVANGVDILKFGDLDKAVARECLGLPASARIVISAGWLIERKGYHKVVSLLPELAGQVDDIYYVILGGAPAHDDYERTLLALVCELGVVDKVLFAGFQPHEEMYKWLSAADVFCLPTSGEGWANVFLEAMACGLPVVTTRVGGNPEVVCSSDYGILFDLDDRQELRRAIVAAVTGEWDRDKIRAYARANTWEDRVSALRGHFERLCKK